MNKRLLLPALWLLSQSLFGQNQIYDLMPLSLSDLSAFKNAPANWRIVGGIKTDYQTATLNPTAGTGILYDGVEKAALNKPNQNLFTAFEHGDMRLELEFMMPKGSNSGIYLQGRYEVQLLDSWGVANPVHGDCGGIYQRWNEATQTGYEGHAPRTNACLAPGLWQHLAITFQAPRFDAAGKKIQHAVMKKVVLNGITIHENVILRGPTRSAGFENEQPTGPLMIQGDHGQVAFRNMRYAILGEFSVPVTDLTYQYYEGHTQKISMVKPESLTRKGAAKAIDFTLADDVNKMCLIFEGTFNIAESGEYQWLLRRNGTASLEVDGKTVIKESWKIIPEQPDAPAKTMLTAGTHTFRLGYMKNFNWRGSALGLFILKANKKPFALHTAASLPDPQPVTEIQVPVQATPQLQRSFYQHGGKKKTHVISVCDPQGIHYAYDLNQAGLLEIWRGNFLDATDMWFERGEPQTAKANGAGIGLPGRCALALVNDKNAALPDTLDVKTLMLKGYTLDAAGLPTFKFNYGAVNFNESFHHTTEGGIKGLQRTIRAVNPTNQTLIYRLAEGKMIVDLGNGLYAVDDQRFYIQVEPNQKPYLRDRDGRKELVVEKGSGSSEVKCVLIF
jgi:Domain of Unknown Function (DUF1080)